MKKQSHPNQEEGERNEPATQTRFGGRRQGRPPFERPEGLEILVIGAPNLGEDPREDVDGQRDWWAD